MDIPVPPPPLAAHGVLLLVLLLVLALPFVAWKKKGWRGCLKTSGLALLLVLPIVLPLAYAMHANRVEVADGRLYVQAGLFYSLHRSVHDFDLAQAQAGPRRDMPQARLGWRQNDIGTRGYAAGHFSLAQGGQAFVLLTDSERVLFLPARVGPSLLVSVDEPEALLQTLRVQAGSTAVAVPSGGG